jgi:hypothetical protein
VSAQIPRQYIRGPTAQRLRRVGRPFRGHPGSIRSRRHERPEHASRATVAGGQPHAITQPEGADTAGPERLQRSVQHARSVLRQSRLQSGVSHPATDRTRSRHRQLGLWGPGPPPASVHYRHERRLPRRVLRRCFCQLPQPRRRLLLALLPKVIPRGEPTGRCVGRCSWGPTRPTHHVGVLTRGSDLGGGSAGRCVGQPTDPPPVT